MFDLAQNIIGSQPILALFLAIGVGYLVGQINFGGFSLGVGAVLFVGLAIGAFAPKSSITGPIGLTGLIMFLYGIGILYGRQFFEGMTGAAGRKYNLLALVACIAGLAGCPRPWQGVRYQDRPHAGHLRRLDDEHGHAASRARCHEKQRSVDRLFDRLSLWRHWPDLVHIFHDASRAAKISAEGAAVSHGRDYARSATMSGERSRISSADLPDGVQVTMVRKGDQNIVPAADLTLACRRRCHDRGGREEAIAEAAAKIGRLEAGRIIRDRSALDYIRVFVGKAAWLGFHSRGCRCRPAFQPICCMFVAMTWTSFQLLI